MPLLLGILRSAEAPEYRKLRAKAMECAGLIGALPVLSSRALLTMYSHCRWHGRVPRRRACARRSPYADTECVSVDVVLQVSINKRRALDSPPDPGDALLPSYLIATWAKVCQALGPEFEPWLPAVMPPLLRAASAKAEVSVLGASLFYCDPLVY